MQQINWFIYYMIYRLARVLVREKYTNHRPESGYESFKLNYL